MSYVVSLICVFLSVTSVNADMLPEFFGIYLRSGEQLMELQPETVAGGGISSLASLTGIAT